MRICPLASLCAFLVLAAPGQLLAQQGQANISASERPELRDENLDPLRRTANEFTEAFNRGDAQAVAACWASGGDYVDETGNVASGREAIAAKYAQFFAEHPGVKIQLTIESLRLVNEGAAIEDGRATLATAPQGAISSSKYSAVHVNVNGQWLLSSVRDLPIHPVASGDLQDLAWLAGTWSAEHRGTKTNSTCRWVAGDRFIERTYSSTTDGKDAAAGVQLIGWNPELGGIQSWNFTSDGGHAVGMWTPNGRGWVVQSLGVLADGTRTTATNIVTYLDHDGYAWQSVSRRAGEAALPDTEELILKRVIDR